MGLQAKPAYWGIVNQSKLPAYGLKVNASIAAGKRDSRIITLTATNGNVGTAYATQIVNLTLKQVSGPSCIPAFRRSPEQLSRQLWATCRLADRQA